MVEATTLKDIEVSPPMSTEDITIGQYLQFSKINIDLEKVEEYNEFVKTKIVNIFCDLDIDVVRSFAAKDVDRLFEHIAIILSKININKKGDLTSIIEIEGVEFGIIPDFENITAGEFADLTEFIKSFDDIHKAMAVLYRPIKKKLYNKYLKRDQYEIIDYEGTSKFSDIMKLMSLEKAMEASFFLRTISERLEVISQSSLQLKKKMKKKKGLKHLKEVIVSKLSQKSGAGTSPSI